MKGVVTIINISSADLNVLMSLEVIPCFYNAVSDCCAVLWGHNCGRNLRAKLGVRNRCFKSTQLCEN